MTYKTHEIYTPTSSIMQISHDMTVCQTDYPLDWYQPEFMPYAEEYLALPDRKLETILKWMTPYMKKAQDHFGPNMLLLAHYYMGGEIVRLIEQFGGQIGDSYQLALMAANNPEKSIIIESAVHFMAESIAILANPHQQVYITNPKSGCTMEMMAKDFMVEPALLELNERYGESNILPICYMNTSGRIKALTGAQGGAVCTSSNVKAVVAWGLAQNKKILFIPDQHMGDNVADWLGIKNLAYWPGGSASAQYQLHQQDAKTLQTFDDAQMIMFSSYCAVHTFYEPTMCAYWKSQDYTTIVHPECKHEVVKTADFSGSTAFIWEHVTKDKSGTKKYAIGTENHMVENLKQHCRSLDITVTNIADTLTQTNESMGCGCATMSRNDPPHLIALVDLLRKGEKLPYNIVKAGDNVNEFSGVRQRLSELDREKLIINAKSALERMIAITEKKL
jgi:quinolinate synthase